MLGIVAITRLRTPLLVGPCFCAFTMLYVSFAGGHATNASNEGTEPAATRKESFRLPSTVPAPLDNLPTPDRVELGKMLFFDPRLSGSQQISCATCHNPSRGWSDGLRTAVGENKRVLARRTLSIMNSGFNSFYMWDGSIDSLEVQAWRPMLASAEMHGVQGQILITLKAIPGYVVAFDKAYAGEGITNATVAKAIANFERTLISRDSPFDRWKQGDASAVNPSAKRGFGTFTGKANCIACHQGSNFTDQGFHNLGLTGNTDPGRFAIVPIRILRGAFKTPTLRDVALTAPYMHNGMYPTLEEVIDHYDRGGDDKQNLDPSMKPLGLTGREKKDLLEFLKSLTGKQAPIAVPKLP